MQLMKWRKYALVLAAGLVLPGFSQAAIVSGETSVSIAPGTISVSATVEDISSIISISWPEDRWVGISFGPTPAHDEGYMIVSSLSGDAIEANAAFRSAPLSQSSQDLTIESFTTAGGISEIVLSRASNTGDPLDFQFEAIEQTIPLQWALGPLGAATSTQHEVRGTFAQDLVLTAIPVPAALPLLASGLFALGLFTRRNKVS
ncbi:MAG: DOMON domain-containing protein [Thiogranum sp.]